MKLLREDMNIREELRESWFIIAVLVLCILKYLIASSLPVFARDAGE